METTTYQHPREDIIPISIWLRSDGLRLNFCMRCRSSLPFQIEGSPKVIIPGDASVEQDGYRPLKFPIKVRCPGDSSKYGKCPALYIIQGYVEE